MTNLTKQEIQAARKFITEREYECDYGYYNQPISETLNEHFDPIKQALDIAENYVWLPISEAPKDACQLLVMVQDFSESCGEGASFTAKYYTQGNFFTICEGIDFQSHDFAYNDETSSYLSVVNPSVGITHYMPQPTPSIAGSTLSDVAKKAGKSASDKVKLSKRV